MPGFVFRMLFLLSIFAAPVLASVLLYPAGVAYASVGRRGQRRKLAVIVGLTPVTVFAGFLFMARLKVLTQGWPMPWWPVLLSTLTLSAFYVAIRRTSAAAESSAEPAAGFFGNGPSGTALEGQSHSESTDFSKESTGPSSQPDASPRKL